ncbi:MAG: hypothetical protein JXA96_08145 [Sedimentisphaerales bacterium]|nr:hypothetical protein [Sedimentisphaerales bacterium]
MTNISEQIKELTAKMIEQHRNLMATKVPEERTKLKQQIAAIDKQIASLVYKLYNLSDEDVKIAKNSTK